jgi:MFS family permease
VVAWNRLSDRIGRRPVLVMGLASVALAAPCFGLSKTLFGMLAARAAAGAFNGNIAVSKVSSLERISISC